MKRIILFRYHHQFERNREWLRFQQYLNPEIKVFGLYGGPPEDFQRAGEVLQDVLDHNFLLQHLNPSWNWKNSDISYQSWFREFGHQLDFDQMHVIEWDLLYFNPLDKLFSIIPKGALGLTGLIPLAKIEKIWYWTRNPKKRAEYLELLDFFRKHFGIVPQPFGMLGPGITLPREFLVRMAEVEIPDLGNDELRIPLLAQAFGFPMHDTGFFRKWFSHREFRYFNSNAFIISQKNIEKQLKRKNGRRVFHPCNQDFSMDQLIQLRQLTL